MVSVETVSIVIAAVSVVIGVINSILSNRKAEEQRQTEIETRQAQLFMQIYSRFSDYQFARSFSDTLYEWEWSNVEDYYNKYGPETNPEENAKGVSVSRFIDGIGLLVKRKLIDIQIVDELMRDLIIRYWDRMSPIREYGRQRYNLPNVFVNMEYLYNELMKRRE